MTIRVNIISLVIAVSVGILPAVVAFGQPANDAPAAVLDAKTRYVSKLGNNTDGMTWATAYTSIQAALEAIPDDQGGYVVVVRPDTYVEANLAPSHPGASGAYNTLVGDRDGTR